MFVLFSVFLFCFFFFFFNDTATTEIYTLSLHDALPISTIDSLPTPSSRRRAATALARAASSRKVRSEEHTSELQSRPHLVCRLLLEKKKKNKHQKLKIKQQSNQPNIK